MKKVNTETHPPDPHQIGKTSKIPGYEGKGESTGES